MIANISRRWFIGGFVFFGGNRIFRDRRPQACRISADQLPQGVEYCFAVRPVNSLGKPGRPIVSTWQPVIPKTEKL